MFPLLWPISNTEFERSIVNFRSCELSFFNLQQFIQNRIFIQFQTCERFDFE
jgi:hypothetical protein